MSPETPETLHSGKLLEKEIGQKHRRDKIRLNKGGRHTSPNHFADHIVGKAE